ncbi:MULTISPECIES: nucleoside hydrolase [unclassified Clostridium]|uniref:nucleoside hydrolase n=1 Tax=unclassified Clostridium TaxID=2614128 RepID=UPI0025B82A40|nr:MULTISPECIES: nucleoside hydrolase [unclassified Clostridium]
MHKIIYDCDNTMGVVGCDVDDGLTLLYLLGREDVDLQGLTLTYGNNTIDVVYETTMNMIKELNLNHIKVFKGSEDHQNRISEASKFLANTVKDNPKEITILATGALTNLYGAYLYDNDFFTNVKEIALMGGVTSPLIIHGHKVDELNFSCDPEASHKVLSSEAKVSILNGHTTMEAIFGPKELLKLESSSNKLFKYILEKINPWCVSMEKLMDVKAFCNWDAAAAIYITNPELFQNETVIINSSVKDLKSGYLNLCEDGKKIYMPSSIIDLETFNEILINGFINTNNNLDI